MRTYICTTTKTSEKRGLVLRTTFSFTIPGGSTRRSDIKRLMRSIMPRCKNLGARSPHGGIWYPSFGSWKKLPFRSQKDLEGTTPKRVDIRYFSLTEIAEKEQTMK